MERLIIQIGQTFHGKPFNDVSENRHIWTQIGFRGINTLRKYVFI